MGVGTPAAPPWQTGAGTAAGAAAAAPPWQAGAGSGSGAAVAVPPWQAGANMTAGSAAKAPAPWSPPNRDAAPLWPVDGEHSATALDKPTFDYEIASDPAAGPPPSAAARAPRPAARPVDPRPVPKSDTGLYIGLGAVVFLIFVLIVAIIIGVASNVGEDSSDPTEQVEGG